MTDRDAAVFKALEEIEGAMLLEGLSQRILAKRVGVSRPTISKLLGHGTGLTVRRLADIASATKHRLEIRLSRAEESNG